MESLDKISDDELLKLEEKWKERFQLVSIPQPTMESSLSLIDLIKKQHDVMQPVDPRAELEEMLAKRSIIATWFDLVLSQWNVYGSKSWLLTALVLFACTFIPNLTGWEHVKSMGQWVFWITLIVIASFGYAYRAQNEGMEHLEKLGRYTLIEQVSVRFVMVLGFQIICTLILSLFVQQKTTMDMLPFFTSWSVPMLFFGALMFLLVQLFRSLMVVGVCICLWGTQVLFSDQLHAFYLFSMPEEPYFWETHLSILFVSIVIIVGGFVVGVRRERHDHTNSATTS